MMDDRPRPDQDGDAFREYMRWVIGGCDNNLRIQQHQEEQDEYEAKMLARRELPDFVPSEPPCCYLALEHGTCLGLCSRDREGRQS